METKKLPVIESVENFLKNLGPQCRDKFRADLMRILCDSEPFSKTDPLNSALENIKGYIPRELYEEAVNIIYRLKKFRDNTDENYEGGDLSIREYNQITEQINACLCRI